MIKKLIHEIDENNEFSDIIDILNNNHDTRVLEKSVIILLVTKMEVFLEQKTSEWFINLIKTNKKSNILSEITKKEIITNTISIIYEEIKNGTISSSNKNKLRNFNLLLDSNYPLKDLDLDFKITLNSHGSAEIKKLLKKIGIDNIFENMEKIDNNNYEELESIKLTSKIDYEGTINKLINYRNNIIHEDILNSLSTEDLNTFINCVNLLAKATIYYLQNNIMT